MDIFVAVIGDAAGNGGGCAFDASLEELELALGVGLDYSEEGFGDEGKDKEWVGGAVVWGQRRAVLHPSFDWGEVVEDHVLELGRDGVEGGHGEEDVWLPVVGCWGNGRLRWFISRRCFMSGTREGFVTVERNLHGDEEKRQSGCIEKSK